MTCILGNLNFTEISIHYLSFFRMLYHFCNYGDGNSGRSRSLVVFNPSPGLFLDDPKLPLRPSFQYPKLIDSKWEKAQDEVRLKGDGLREK